MQEIIRNLFVGNEFDCKRKQANFVVHACKTPCHQKRIGYLGSLPPTHPNYLFLEDSDDIYLNIVDMNRELLPKFVDIIFQKGLDFIDKKIKEPVLVHCNQGESRAPSITLVYLAKRANVIPNGSFQEALKEFRIIYPHYNPALGLRLYLERNWERLK